MRHGIAIKSGFRVTGVCPFDKSAITLPEEKFQPGALTGLSYRLGSPIYHVQYHVPCGSSDSDADSKAARLNYYFVLLTLEPMQPMQQKMRNHVEKI